MVRSLFHLSLRLNRSLSLWRLIVRRFLEGDVSQHGHSSAGHPQSYDFQAARINKCFRLLTGFSR